MFYLSHLRQRIGSVFINRFRRTTAVVEANASFPAYLVSSWMFQSFRNTLILSFSEVKALCLLLE